MFIQVQMTKVTQLIKQTLGASICFIDNVSIGTKGGGPDFFEGLWMKPNTYND